MASAMVGAAVSVLLKALGPVADPVLEAWAASKGLGANVKALKTELLCVKAVLELRLGREIRNTALENLLWNLQDLAYDAEDVLDELDYFRIQDELHGTFNAADEHPKGCAHNLVLNATHAAKAVGRKIRLPACTSSASAPGAKLRARSTISSSPQADGDVGEANGCMPKLSGAPSTITRAVGKCLPCSALPPVDDDDDDDDDNDDANPPTEHAKEITKLEFNRVDVSKRIELILQQLQPMRQNICMILGALDPNQQSSAAQSHPHTTSESIETKLYGRDPILKSIIYDITRGKYSDEGLTVLPIVGPGGIGKTALAQHIYHSKEVLQRFDVKVWICVSLNFNVDMLTEGIEKYIPRVENENNGTAAELIGQRLKSKRFLLVLDDMWECSNEDEWARLLLPFRKSQKIGNMIIVTTRQPAIAQTVTKPNHSIELGGLAFEEFKDLFLSFVFNDEQSRRDHPELLAIGDKIIEKLKGSPLAAKTVGRLLRHPLDYYHWTRVLESQEWTEQKGENDIMPALKLSYDYLPFYLKPCFCYCALFPQDYRFGREELVHLWIGLDVLYSPGQNKRIEDIGLSHLAELVNRGFLKDEEKYGQTYYVIHDLLHELALKVSSRECLSIYSSNVGSIQVLPSVRHLSINIDDTSCQDRRSFDTCMMHLSTLDKDKGLEVEKLHSLMLFGRYHGNFVKTLCDLFREAKALRVLFVSEASYNVEDLLSNLLKFIHLRYLRIGWSARFSEIILPNNISTLYQLRVLDIQGYRIANDLPRDITNLIKLRHFLVRDDELHSSIFEVGRLKWLQQLRRFVVKNESQGFELTQLGDLVELGGSLQIGNLERVEGKEEAGEAKLSQKKYLHKLIMDWDSNRSNKDTTNEDQVLEGLMPSSNLRELCIRGHGGTDCPSWLGTNLSVPNLESFQLDDVDWKSLPPLGGLWLTDEQGKDYQSCITSQNFNNLKRLELVKIPKLKKWIGNGPCEMFSHLKALIIRDCPKLMELPFTHHTGCGCERDHEDHMTWFPKLEVIEIVDCPNLSSFPCIPWSTAMCSVKIEQVGSTLEHLNLGKNYTSEYCLRIEGKDALDSSFWRVLSFHNLSKLEVLEVTRCPPLSLGNLQMLSSLKTLELSDMGNANGEALTRLLSYFVKLRNVKVSRCEMLTGLSVVDQQNKTGAPELPVIIEVENEAHIVRQEEQQDDTSRKEEIAAAATSSEGLLLLPPQLQELQISECPNLVLCIDSIFDNKDTGETGSRGRGLQGLRSLRSLWIRDCPRFLSSDSSSSDSSYPPFPPSLEHLSLWGEVGTATPLPLSNLTSLTDLSIWGRGDLRSEGLQHLLAQGRLTKLFVRETPNFFAGPEPPLPHEQESPSSSSKPQELDTDDVAGVLAPPICTLLSSSLTELRFWEDREVERFTKEQEDALQLLTSLEEISFWFCDKLQCLPAGLRGLHNLKRLIICGCAAIRSLPKDGLPSSLQVLGIGYCPAIQSLPKDCFPASLQKLEIESCPAIRSLPKDCLPSSLQKLLIRNCPAIRSLPKVNDLPSSLRELDVRVCGNEELTRQCRKLIGIIPVVYTD